MPKLIAIALLCLSNGAVAQQDLLGGKVIDVQGRPVPAASISFSMLEGRGETARQEDGEYGMAKTRHLLSHPDPEILTDEKGEWRRSLSASETAILTTDSHAFLMAVRARGFLPWFRAVGGDLRDAATKEVILEEGRPIPYLQIQLEGGSRPYRGYAVIERAFRVPKGSSVWLPSILPLSDSGQFEFNQSPRIPGEIHAPGPTAREEAYRVSIFAAGLQPSQSMISPGEWRLRLEASSDPDISVLGIDGKAALGPIHASYVIAGREVTLRLPTAFLPKLGGLAPTRVRDGQGELLLSGWPEAQQLRLRPLRSAGFPSAAGGRAALSTLGVTVVDSRGRPVPGAAIWLENAAVERAPENAQVFAISDADGLGILRDLPRGRFRFLIRHPSAGSRETELDVRAALEQAIVPIRPQARRRAPRVGRPGTLLLDLGHRTGAASELPTELGIITNDRQLVREDFAQRPRWIRVDGLPIGAANLYLESKGEKAALIAGVLSGGFDNPAFKVAEIQSRRFELFVRDVEGNPLGDVSLSFGEGPPGSIPYTSRLIRVEKGELPGSFWFQAPIHGNPLLRVHDEDGNYLDVLVPIKSQERFVEVVLTGR